MPVAGAFSPLAPEEIAQILEHVSLRQRCRVLGTCRMLWGLHDEINGCLRHLELTDSDADSDAASLMLHEEVQDGDTSVLRTAEISQSRVLCWSRLQGLRSLSLGSLATDSACVRACVSACVRFCVRALCMHAFLRACALRACVSACVRSCVQGGAARCGSECAAPCCACVCACMCACYER